MLARRLAACFLAAALLCACRPEKEEKPPTNIAGFWFGSWSGANGKGNAFYMELEQEDGSDEVQGTIYSSTQKSGTVTGTVSGKNFVLEAEYELGEGSTETYDGSAFLDDVTGAYNGTLQGEAVSGAFSMTPSELAPSTTTDVEATVTGLVVDTTGSPVSGATVVVGVGDGRRQATTGSSGTFSLSAVPGGPRVAVAYKSGLAAGFQPFVIDADSETVPSLMLPPAAGNPDEAPTVGTSHPKDGFETTSSVIVAEGTAIAAGGSRAVVSINEGEYLLPLDGTAFTYALILSRGVNRVVLQAANGVGVTEKTLLMNVDTPFKRIRVTLVWDTGNAIESGNEATENDQDMHIWYYPESGAEPQHAAYTDQIAITNGEIDVDNVWGFGPENFTMSQAGDGTYYVAVNYYSGPVDGSGSEPTNNIIRVSLNEGTEDETVALYGPYPLTQSNGNSDYPVTGQTASWWRVVDIDVQDGIASIAPGTNPDLSMQLED